MTENLSKPLIIRFLYVKFDGLAESAIVLRCPDIVTGSDTGLSRSISGLLLVPERQHIDGFFGCDIPIERDIPRIPEGDHQLAEFNHFGKKTPGLRSGFQQRELSFNSLGCPRNRPRVARDEKSAAAL
jgi:hypothetical protein